MLIFSRQSAYFLKRFCFKDLIRCTFCFSLSTYFEQIGFDFQQAPVLSKQEIKVRFSLLI